MGTSLKDNLCRWAKKAGLLCSSLTFHCFDIHTFAILSIKFTTTLRQKTLWYYWENGRREFLWEKRKYEVGKGIKSK